MSEIREIKETDPIYLFFKISNKVKELIKNNKLITDVYSLSDIFLEIFRSFHILKPEEIGDPHDYNIIADETLNLLRDPSNDNLVITNINNKYINLHIKKIEDFLITNSDNNIININHTNNKNSNNNTINNLNLNIINNNQSENHIPYFSELDIDIDDVQNRNNNRFLIEQIKKGIKDNSSEAQKFLVPNDNLTYDNLISIRRNIFIFNFTKDEDWNKFKDLISNTKYHVKEFFATKHIYEDDSFIILAYVHIKEKIYLKYLDHINYYCRNGCNDEFNKRNYVSTFGELIYKKQ